MAGDTRRDDILLNLHRQQSLDRMRKGEADKLDVMVVSLWQTGDGLAEAVKRNDDYHKPPTGARGLIRAYGPHWGWGAGGAGILITLLETLGRILGR